MTQAVSTEQLRPRCPQGYKLLLSEFGGYFFEDAEGVGSDDYGSAEAALRAARKHAKGSVEGRA